MSQVDEVGGWVGGCFSYRSGAAHRNTLFVAGVHLFFLVVLVSFAVFNAWGVCVGVWGGHVLAVLSGRTVVGGSI